MFYNLFFNWDKSVEELYEFIELNVDYESCVKEGNSKRYLTHDFSLRLNSNKVTLQFKNEDYQQNFNVLLLFEVMPNTNWAVKLFRFAGELMKLHDGACLMESNGDTPVLYRADDEIIVDDSKLHGAGLPFDELTLKYQKGELKRI